MFFRKKRQYGEVAGYDRISRGIGDREDERDEGEEDLFEEDTVLLTQSGPDTAPLGGERASGEWPSVEGPQVEGTVTVVRAPRVAVQSEPQPAVTSAAASGVSAPFEAPRMSLPDLSIGFSQAGGASLVAKDAVWEGKFVCSGDIRIEGTLRGEIDTQATLFVAAEAHVDGTVRARNVTLAGEIQGTLRCEERLEILPGGAARGDVDTGALVVHEGAYIDSRFQMGRQVT